MTGFLMGILYTNIVSGDYVAAMGMFDDYALNRYMQTDIIVQDYFWYLLPVRIVPLAVIVLLGRMRIRKGVAVGVFVWTGFLLGLLFTAAIIKMGVKGLLFCLACLFPHGIFYGVGYGILLWYLYLYPKIRWDTVKTMTVFLLISAGIVLECYANPFFMKMFINFI